MSDKWSGYKKQFCGCKDGSRLNSCKGLPNCSLRADDPERKTPSAQKTGQQAMTNKLEITREALLAAANRLSDRGQADVAAPLWEALAEPVPPLIQTLHANGDLKAGQRQGEPVASVIGTVVGGDCSHNTVTVQVLGDVPSKLWTMSEPVTLTHGHPAEPPAPVAVVLPQPIQWYEDYSDERKAEIDGWNACLDKVKELNP